MQKQIILPSLKHSNSFVQCLNVYWADLGECYVIFWVQNNFEDMYFFHLKVLRKNN